MTTREKGAKRNIEAKRKNSLLHRLLLVSCFAVVFFQLLHLFHLSFSSFVIFILFSYFISYDLFDDFQLKVLF